MKVRRLSVEGALEFTPQVFRDDRGLFCSPFQDEAFVNAHGGPLPMVAQTSHSQSRRGTVRGIHYTATPPGNAKYVYCPSGRALDIVVDIRVGSPSFGRWDSVVLDQDDFRALYLPVGVGHAFVALADDTIMSYMFSTPYVAANELALAAQDRDLGLPIPRDLRLHLSDRDRAAPRLAEARAQGLLPDYHRCQEIEFGRSGIIGR